MVLMRVKTFRGPLDGVGPENRDFFGPFMPLKWQRAKQVHAICVCSQFSRLLSSNIIFWGVGSHPKYANMMTY
jgi:hypothetical protein